MLWHMYRVMKTHSSRDGIVRVVTVKTATGLTNGRYTLYHSFSCPKFQLPIKSPEVTIFEKQFLTKIMKGMR